jgi:hypothetical protein
VTKEEDRWIGRELVFSNWGVRYSMLIRKMGGYVGIWDYGWRRRDVIC